MRVCLSCLLAVGLLISAPAAVRAAQAPDRPLVLAPEPAPAWAWPGVWDVLVPGAVSGALLGLASVEPVASAIASSGAIGQVGFLAAAAALPPAAELRYRAGSALPADGYISSLSLGLVGLGLGFAASRPFASADAGAARPTLASIGLMALGQGLGSALGYRLYQHFRTRQADWDRLPAQRTDDPIKNWNDRKERQNRF